MSPDTPDINAQGGTTAAITGFARSPAEAGSRSSPSAQQSESAGPHTPAVAPLAWGSARRAHSIGPRKEPERLPPDLPGARLTPLDAESCACWLAGLQGAGHPVGDFEPLWALAHLDDGLAWARYDAGAGRWRQGHEAFPELAPMIAVESLRELRLFGPTGEILIWRGWEGLRGRLLTENEPGWTQDESRILLGERLLADPQLGFTPIGERSGSTQVVPLTALRRDLQARRLRLQVRHYFERHRETGAVRIAATRLVELSRGEQDTHGA